MKTLNKPVPEGFMPGGTIGIIGGGQLGRMLALAAARLGLKTAIYNDAADAPAFQVTQTSVAAPYEDLAALARFADACDVVTFEFENLPGPCHRPSGGACAGASRRACFGDHPGPADGKKLCRKAGLEDRALL